MPPPKLYSSNYKCVLCNSHIYSTYFINSLCPSNLYVKHGASRRCINRLVQVDAKVLGLVFIFQQHASHRGKHGGQLPRAGARRGGGIAGAEPGRRLPHRRGPDERHAHPGEAFAAHLPQPSRYAGDYILTTLTQKHTNTFCCL